MWSNIILSDSRPRFVYYALHLFWILFSIWISAAYSATNSNLANAFPSSPTPYTDLPQITWRVAVPFAPFQVLPPHVKNIVSEIATPQQGEPFQQWVQRIASSSDRSPFAYFLAPEHQVENNRAADVQSFDISNPWDDSRQKYQSAYVHPTHTDILVSLQGAMPNSICSWRQENGPLSTPTPCATETLLKQVPLTGVQIQAFLEKNTPPITTSVKIDHKVIAALGDSYASGEGNPDVPTHWHSESVRKGSLNWINISQRSDARWWDNICHRSFYSSQTLVALRLSYDSPHRLVTYLHYACSGAEVFDGLLVPQKNPPGIAETCRGKNCLLSKSQLAMMVEDLCTAAAIPLENNEADVQHIEQLASTAGMLRMDVYDETKLNLLRCEEGKLRQPDLILLSIGGNDAGFSSLVQWAILPERFWFGWVGRRANADIVCPDGAELFDMRCRGDGKNTKVNSGILIEQLPQRIDALYHALKLVLHPDIANSIVHATYPDPMRKNSNEYCHDPYGENRAGPWASLAFLIPSIGQPKKWHINAVKAEVELLSKQTLPSLFDTLMKAITRNNAHVADLQSIFQNHGWCQLHLTTEPPISLPSAATGKQADAWTCDGKERNPSCWNAYAPSQRYIRTANDAFLTQHSKSRDDGRYGMMHPNLHGNAEMASRIFPMAQNVLQ